MDRVWRALRLSWWLVVGVGAAAVGLLAVLVFWRQGRREAITWRPGMQVKKPLRERAQEEVERVRLEGELEKAKAKAYAQTQRAELRRIENRGKEDPKVARQHLARWLQDNL